MKKKRLILIVENSIDITGAVKAIASAAQELSSFFNFEFVIPRKSTVRPWIADKGFPFVHEIPMKELSKRYFSLLLYFEWSSKISLKLHLIPL